MSAPVGRLAPTPSGELHLGNALAFYLAFLSIRQTQGRLLLRIEDVDRGRSRREIEQSQRHDLAWLGIQWDEEVPPQGQRDYEAPLSLLADRAYYCRCTRKEVAALGGVHPLSCRDAQHRSGAVRFALEAGNAFVPDLHFGPRVVDALSRFGDPVLRRRDGFFTYNLAVVADDLRDGVTEVCRGADLLDFSAVQLQLWSAFGATPPRFSHAPLVLGPDSAKLSKSHGDTGISALRDAGWSPARLRDLLQVWLGLPAGLTQAEAIARFAHGAGPRGALRLTGEPLSPSSGWALEPLPAHLGPSA